MHVDTAVVVAVITGLAAIITGLLTWSAKRGELRTAEEAGLVGNYVHLVADQRAEITRLQDALAALRTENADLDRQVRDLRRQVDDLADRIPQQEGTGK